jgi:hypothetical protein
MPQFLGMFISPMLQKPLMAAKIRSGLRASHHRTSFVHHLLQMLLPTAGIETDAVFVAFFGLLFFVGGGGRGRLEAAGTGSEGREGTRE